ncbi:MAG: LacI family transcriptional regulator [Actinobacteria bacterium]|nr:LacI family transcriptional regulator [Actinomycetota bacterium]
MEKILSTLRIPVVLVGGAIDRPKYDNIRVDSERGVGMAVDYFFSAGRKKILFLNGPWITNPAKRRKEGFLESMRSHQIKNPENYIANAKAFNPKAAVEVLSGIKKLNQFSAILCANDLLAAGAIKFLSGRKIKVPDDIAVIGIDNTDLAGLLTPTLTSVDFKAEYRGELAAKYLLERLVNPNLPIKKTIIEPELIIRESA